MRLILASASPRRAELLRAAGFEFECAPADVDGLLATGEDPRHYALRVARDKATTIQAACRDAGTLILSGGHRRGGKRRNPGKTSRFGRRRADASTLSARAHDVHTAVVIRRGQAERSQVVTTRVWFQPLDASEISWYVASGEPEGKAGAYAIQGRAARYIERIDGSWSNVVGLPVAAVYRLLHELQYPALID